MSLYHAQDRLSMTERNRSTQLTHSTVLTAHAMSHAGTRRGKHHLHYLYLYLQSRSTPRYYTTVHRKQYTWTRRKIPLHILFFIQNSKKHIPSAGVLVCLAWQPDRASKMARKMGVLFLLLAVGMPALLAVDAQKPEVQPIIDGQLGGVQDTVTDDASMDIEAAIWKKAVKQGKCIYGKKLVECTKTHDYK